MSWFEYVSIQSTIHAIYYPLFNCKDCLSEYTRRGDYAGRKAEYDGLLNKKLGLKGCHGGEKIRAQVEEIKYYRCIGNFRSEQVERYIELYYLFQKGILPFSGSLMDQPSKIIDVFNIIDACIKTKQAELEDREKRKAKTNGRR